MGFVQEACADARSELQLWCVDESKTSLVFVESKEILIHKDTCTVNERLLFLLGFS